MSKIFVALLTHNNGRFIESAINSVLNQTFENWSLLISDDASCDNTSKFVKPYLTDHRITYIKHTENLKQPKNWTYALNLADAEILATLHADDTWYPDTLEIINSIYEKNNDLDMLWGNWTVHDENMHPIKGRNPSVQDLYLGSSDSALSYVIKNNFTLPSATSISRRVLVKAGYPNEEYQILCDREFFLRVAASSKSCASTSKNLTQYRVNTSGITSSYSKSQAFYEECYQLCNDIKKITSTHKDPNNLIMIFKNEMGKLFLRDAYEAKINKNYELETTLKNYARGLTQNMNLPYTYKLRKYFSRYKHMIKSNRQRSRHNINL